MNFLTRLLTYCFLHDTFNVLTKQEKINFSNKRELG